jgi:hypothetical protein
MRAEKSAATKATTTTLALTRAMAATFFPDRKRVINDNEALDWQHAVVSVAFCDFVLLDGATCDMVRRAQRMHRALHRHARWLPSPRSNQMSR